MFKYNNYCFTIFQGFVPKWQTATLTVRLGLSICHSFIFHINPVQKKYYYGILNINYPWAPDRGRELRRLASRAREVSRTLIARNSYFAIVKPCKYRMGHLKNEITFNQYKLYDQFNTS